MWYGKQQKLTSLVDFQSNEVKLFHFSLGMGPLQLTVTCSKIHHVGEQVDLLTSKQASDFEKV